MNVEIGTETAQFPEKEYINGIFLAVHTLMVHDLWCQYKAIGGFPGSTNNNCLESYNNTMKLLLGSHPNMSHDDVCNDDIT
jgi:hypothetical protein